MGGGLFLMDNLQTIEPKVQPEINSKKVPSVWIGCLAAYNSGRLYGEWVVIPDDPEELREEIKRVLSKSPEPMAEEWAFMDYEYVPSSFGENPDLEALCEYAFLYNEYGEAVTAFIELYGVDNLSETSFQDCYRGSWDSFDDFAYEDADNMLQEYANEPNSFLTRYFDYEKWARDLSYDYNSWDIGGSCYVFANC